MLTIFLAAAMAAGCAAMPRITDWGLHRQWVMERDCAHPERPGRLVAAPWCDPPAGQPGVADPGAGDRSALPVRPGMTVTLWQRTGRKKIQLSGTALAAGRLGDRIRVRAEWRSAVLSGVVRGPAEVELVEREPDGGR